MNPFKKIAIDPRGIIREVLSVNSSPEKNTSNMSCGHIKTSAPHFDIKPGMQMFCFHCGQESRAKEGA